MAVETRDLVKVAADERQQIERHHQQAMMPIVHIEANCSMVVSNEKVWIVLEGDLVNIGAGPCTGINILIKPLGFVERISYQGLLGANSRRHFKIEWQLSGPVPFQQQLPHDCITRFATIFSTEGAIHQHSHSGLAKDSIVQNYVSPTDEDARKKITEMIGILGVSSSPIPT